MSLFPFLSFLPILAVKTGTKEQECPGVNASHLLYVSLSSRLLRCCSSNSWAVALMYTPCIPHAQSKSDDFFYFPSTQAWLRKFGYLSQASRQMSTMQSAQIMSKAISDMQRLYGLEVTGKVDSATLV